MPATQILWDLRKSCIRGVSDSPSSLHWLIKVIQSYVDQSPSAPTQVACDDPRWMTSWAEVLSGGRDRSQAPLVFRKGTGAPFCSAWAPLQPQYLPNAIPKEGTTGTGICPHTGNKLQGTCLTRFWFVLPLVSLDSI